MNNREQIKARIERDKARKAAKKYERAHGTWRPADCFTLEELSAAINAAVHYYAFPWEHPSALTLTTNKTVKSHSSAALAKIRELNRKIPVEERLSRVSPYGEFRWVFSLRHLMQSLQKRRKGKEWKGNVQRFLFRPILKLLHILKDLYAGKLNVDGTIRRILLHERGKRRTIHAVMIDCRVVQGCLSDSCLIPLTENYLIRDNPASVKGKGVSDARNRLNLFLHELAQQFGNDFYVLTGDFKKFFDSVRHIDCLKAVKNTLADPMIQGLTMKVTRMYQEGELESIADKSIRAQLAYDLKHHKGVGMTLGSQVSQVMALVVPNGIDHAVKDFLGLRAYERYMDDTVSADRSKERLKEVGRTLRNKATEIGLRLNPKKTAIIKASKGFKFMQIHYRVTETGHLVKRLSRAGIVRMRRKLKKFRKKVDRNEMTLDNVYGSFSSWFGNTFHAFAYKTRKRMLTLYHKLFHGYRMEGVYA